MKSITRSIVPDCLFVGHSQNTRGAAWCTAGVELSLAGLALFSVKRNFQNILETTSTLLSHQIIFSQHGVGEQPRGGTVVKYTKNENIHQWCWEAKRLGPPGSRRRPGARGGRIGGNKKLLNAIIFAMQGQLQEAGTLQIIAAASVKENEHWSSWKLFLMR